MRTHTLMASLLLLGCCLATSCIDDKYDLDEVDGLLAFGSDDISLPGDNSTAEITLDDILELSDDEFVKTGIDGDYVCSEEGDDITPAHPKVATFTVSRTASESQRMVVNIPQSSITSGTYTIPAVTAHATVETFNYEAELPKEIIGLQSVNVDVPVTMSITFSDDMRQLLPLLDEMTIKMPSYLTLANVNVSTGSFTMDSSTNTITLSNISTANDITLTAVATRLGTIESAPQGETNYLYMVGNTIYMHGMIDLTVTFSQVCATSNAKECVVTTNYTMENLTVTEATGYFNPTIDLDDVGQVKVNNVPSFLTDEGVSIDLYNPQISLMIENDADMAAIMDAQLTSRDKQGNTLATVNVEGISIGAATTSNICIARRADAVMNASAYNQIIECSDLSNLVLTIPNTIDVTTTATPVTTRLSTIQLGKEYTVNYNYAFEAPLSFDEDAVIVYADTLDGWHDDLGDINLSQDAIITVQADVENKVPAYVQASAIAIDYKGQEMSSDRISIDVEGYAPASPDGQQATNSQINITITQNDDTAFEDLDGIIYRLNCSASYGDETVTGVTLNSYNQTILLKNIKVRLQGKVVVDAN